MQELIKQNMSSLAQLIQFCKNEGGKVLRDKESYKIPDWFFAELQINETRFACSKKGDKHFIYYFNEANIKERGSVVF